MIYWDVSNNGTVLKQQYDTIIVPAGGEHNYEVNY